ncbi:MAG: hypothetical protein KC994_15075, partial [Candidatus Omnitrophica bacterium]|nr:hypothetical protein [Candidatus Omnitrophota bacterium]
VGGQRRFSVRGDFTSNASRPTLVLKTSPRVWFVFALFILVAGIVTFAVLMNLQAPSFVDLFFPLMIGIVIAFLTFWEFRKIAHLMDEVEDLLGKREQWWKTENRDDHP